MIELIKYFYALIINLIPVLSLNSILINSGLNVTYNDVPTVNILSSNNVSKTAKCLLACEIINCNSIGFANNTCTLYDGNPDRLNTSLVTNLQINFIYGKFFLPSLSFDKID